VGERIREGGGGGDRWRWAARESGESDSIDKKEDYKEREREGGKEGGRVKPFDISGVIRGG
jgi:hypothetical protein